MLVSVCLLRCNLNANAKSKNSGYLNPSPTHHQHNWAKNYCVLLGASIYQGVKVRKEVKILEGHSLPLHPQVTPMLKVNDTVNCNLQVMMCECMTHVHKIQIHGTAGVLNINP